MTTLRRVSSLSNRETAELWTQVRANSPGRSPFNSLEFVKEFTRAFKLSDDVLIVGPEDSPDAMMLLYSKQNGPFASLFVPTLLPETPLLLESAPTTASINQQKSALDVIASWVMEEYDSAEIQLPQDIVDPRSFQWKGWAVTPLFTLVAPTGAPFSTSSWSKGTVQVLEKHKADYYVSRTNGQEAVLGLVEQSYSRSGRTLPVDRGALTRLVENLVKMNIAIPYRAISHGNQATEAGVILVRDGNRACYWLAGSVPGPAMTVLIGHIMKDLSESDISEIDFVGANTPGIAEFKRHFGSRLVPSYACSIVPSRPLRLLKSIR